MSTVSANFPETSGEMVLSGGSKIFTFLKSLIINNL